MTKPLAFLLLFLLVAVTYVNTLPGEFVYDDQQTILEAPAIRTLHDWTKDARPLTTLSYAIDFKLWAKPAPNGWTIEPMGFKVTNILLHAINSCLVFLILSMLFQSGLAPFAGAALFAVHPVFLQAVGYISGRSSVLCGMFYFAGILIFQHTFHDEAWTVTYRLSKWWQIYKSPVKTATLWENVRVGVSLFGLAVFILCAWFSKQEAIALPFFLFVLYALRGDKYVWKVAFGVLVVLMAAYAKIAHTLDIVTRNESLSTAGFAPVMPLATYFPTYVSSLIGYHYSKFLLPLNLTVDPAYSQSSIVSPSFLIALAILGLAILLLRKASFPVKFGILAILVSPLSFYAFTPMDVPLQGHRAYIAGLGVAVLFAAFAEWLKAPLIMWEPQIVGAILGLALITVHQNERWNSGMALWKQATEVNPTSFRAWNNYGLQLESRSLATHNPATVGLAYGAFARAVELKPDLWATQVNMATMLIEHGNLATAEEMLLKVISGAPKLWAGWHNLGLVRARQGRFKEAVELYNKALMLNPNPMTAQMRQTAELKLKGQK